MRLVKNINSYDYKTRMKIERDFYTDKGWLNGISHQNYKHGNETRPFMSDRRSIVDDCYPVSNYDNSFHVGEEIYIDDNEENVFVDPTDPNVVHIVTACKTTDFIYSKVISLGLFTQYYTEIVSEKDSGGNYIKDEYGNYIWEHYSDKREYEDIINILHPQAKESDKRQLLDSYDLRILPKISYPFTNEVHDVFDALNNKNPFEKWNAIKGKSIKVIALKELCTLTTATKVRMITVPIFTFIDKDINTEIKNEYHYEPRFFIRSKCGNLNYRIIVDEKTQLKGLMNLDTGKQVCRCFFDDISYSDFLYTVENPPEGMVKFTKNGYEAMCELSQLEKTLKKRKV